MPLDYYLFEIFYRDRDPARPTLETKRLPNEQAAIDVANGYLKLDRVASVGVAKITATSIVAIVKKEPR